jgi:hypothetical protein
MKPAVKRRAEGEGGPRGSFKEHMKSGVKTSATRKGGSQGVSPWSFKGQIEVDRRRRREGEGSMKIKLLFYVFGKSMYKNSRT